MFSGFHQRTGKWTMPAISVSENSIRRFVWYSCGMVDVTQSPVRDLIKEPRKVDDARHIGIGEFYSAFCVVFVWHGVSFDIFKLKISSLMASS